MTVYDKNDYAFTATGGMESSVYLLGHVQIYLFHVDDGLLGQSPCVLTCPKPVLQSEANCETIDLKMILILMQIKWLFFTTAQ